MGAFENCPGAADVSVGVGNYPTPWSVAGVFLGAYARVIVRSLPAGSDVADSATAD